MNFKWEETILANHAEDYPFFRFFKQPGKFSKSVIDSVNEWATDDSVGLVITGPGRQHLLYLVAFWRGYPIVPVSDLSISVAKMMSDRTGFVTSYDSLLNSYVSHINAFDGIGAEESGYRLHLIQDVVERLWKMGKGIVGSVSLGLEEFAAKYGQETLDKVSKSCKLVQL